MKLFLKIITSLIFFVFIIIIILSYGITTKKFNNNIKIQIEKNVPNSKAYFKYASISLDLLSFALKIKIINPIIEIDKQNINIKSLAIYTDIKSSIQKEYLLHKIEIVFNENKFSKLEKTQLINKALFLNNIKFLEGSIKGKLEIGKLKNKKSKIAFNGDIIKTSVVLYEDIPPVNDLNAKVKFKNEDLFLENLSAVFRGFAINAENINYNINERKVDGSINLVGDLNGAVNLDGISKKYLNFNLSNLQNLGGALKFYADLNLELDKNFKIKKDQSKMRFQVNDVKFDYEIDERKYNFAKVNSIIMFNKDGMFDVKSTFLLNSKKNNIKVFRKTLNKKFNLNADGEINIKKLFFPKKDFLINGDVSYSLKTKIKDLKDLEKFEVSSYFDLKNSEIDLSFLNFTKSKGVNSNVQFVFKKNKKKFSISKFNFKSKSDNIMVGNIEFDKNFNMSNFDKIKVKLGEKNNIEIDKNKNNFFIFGNNLDLTELLKQRGRNKDIKLSPLINGNLKVDIKNVYLPSAKFINYKTTAKVIKGEIVKLNSFANFDDLTTFSHEVKKNDTSNKVLIIKSDKAKPFVSNYNFLNGLDGGTLEIYRETFSDDFSVTEIKVKNFYLSELPVLTKILSLASFTGISDLLNGKGIFFKEAYLKYELLDNELKIIDCYGTGPSLGFIIEGRVGKDDFVSLRGNLAPANMVNNFVRGVPLIGKVLTGKKGDGIFGASFKIKGKDNFETEVNPIKTITPRFIQRFIKVFKK